MTTEAEKWLLDLLHPLHAMSPRVMAEGIASIKAEAVAEDRKHRGWTADDQASHDDHDEGLIAAERARIAEKVRRLTQWYLHDDGMDDRITVDRAAVLAIIEGEP